MVSCEAPARRAKELGKSEKCGASAPPIFRLQSAAEPSRSARISIQRKSCRLRSHVKFEMTPALRNPSANRCLAIPLNSPPLFFLCSSSHHVALGDDVENSAQALSTLPTDICSSEKRGLRLE